MNVILVSVLGLLSLLFAGCEEESKAPPASLRPSSRSALQLNSGGRERKVKGYFPLEVVSDEGKEFFNGRLQLGDQSQSTSQRTLWAILEVFAAVTYDQNVMEYLVGYEDILSFFRENEEYSQFMRDNYPRDAYSHGLRKRPNLVSFILATLKVGGRKFVLQNDPAQKFISKEEFFEEFMSCLHLQNLQNPYPLFHEFREWIFGNGRVPSCLASGGTAEAASEPEASPPFVFPPVFKQSAPYRCLSAEIKQSMEELLEHSKAGVKDFSWRIYAEAKPCIDPNEYKEFLEENPQVKDIVSDIKGLDEILDESASKKTAVRDEQHIEKINVEEEFKNRGIESLRMWIRILEVNKILCNYLSSSSEHEDIVLFIMDGIFVNYLKNELRELKQEMFLFALHLSA